ncbi:MAG: hypothetical protein MI922_27020, partial [Bacteroidales bacterium]|nr:hypothetical protein [Bacteroidales bacterium]
MRISIAIICLLVCNSIVKGQDNIEKDLGALFNKYEINGSFVLFNQSENKYIRHNSTFCDSGFIPASTFKIPNALIALEEKVITDTLQVIKWDGREHPVSQWNRDQTLKTAIKYSCVWAFVNIATQIETETYKKYIQKFRYGNQDIKGLSNRFWLQGKLRISANQQVEFLRKMYNYKL